jgi:transposase
VRFIGLDVHRDFCEVAISEGGKARSAGRVASSPEALRVLGQSLLADDKVILESTGNALEIARELEPFVSEVVIANPMHVRAISHAKVKNDQFDARTLAELLAADLVPRCGSGMSARVCCAGSRPGARSSCVSGPARRTRSPLCSCATSKAARR